MGLTTRMLQLNSWVSSSKDPANFTQALARPLTGVQSVAFVSCTIPNLIPAFTPGWDDKIVIETLDGSVYSSHSITVPEGRIFPDVASFCTWLNTAMQASTDTRLHNISVAFDATVLRLVLTDSLGSCRMKGYAPDSGLDGNFRLGWTKASYPYAGTCVADGYPGVILRTNSIKIHCSLVGSTLGSLPGDSDMLFSVPVTAPVGGIIAFENHNASLSLPASGDQLTDLSIRLSDEDGQTLVLPSNANVSVQLMVHCEE
jgi:hypothetical protein